MGLATYMNYYPIIAPLNIDYDPPPDPSRHANPEIGIRKENNMLSKNIMIPKVDEEKHEYGPSFETSAGHRFQSAAHRVEIG
jgi:hypothetical protein